MTSAPAPTGTTPAAGPATRPAGGLATGPATGTRAPVSRRRALARSLLHGTPGRMRLFAALSVLAALLVGAITANALLTSRAAAERAANNTAQVIRAQSLHVDLLRADALATNAFLGGGLEPAEQRARYDAAIAAAATGIAEAAAAQPADARALGALADEVRSYAALVEQARANNRLGMPVGAQYLRQASAGLRSDAIPIVEAVSRANEGRASAEFGRANSLLQLTVGVLAIGLLGAVALWLARRTHRYLNGPLTAAMALLLAVLAVAAWAIGGIAQTTGDVERGEYATAIALANASTAANDARSNESLTLIARGSGQALEQAWRNDDLKVRANLQTVGTGLSPLWTRYGAAHTTIRKLDDGGQWDQAVQLATSSAASGAGTLFAAFDTQVTAERDAASAAAVDRLDGLGGWVPLLTVAVGLAALVASWLVVRGLGRRIEEYR